MINNYSNFVKYIGMGTTKEYSFPFKITDVNQIRVLVFDSSGVFQYSEVGQGGINVESIKFNINKAGGVVVLRNNLSGSSNIIIKLSMNEGLQPYQYREQDDFRMRHFENGLDHALVHIQRLYEKFTRVIGFSEKFSINTNIDPTIDDYKIYPGYYIRSTLSGMELRNFNDDVNIKISDYLNQSNIGNWGYIGGDLSMQTDLMNLFNMKEDVANKSSDVDLGTSDTLYPTQNAVKTYVDSKQGGTFKMEYLTNDILDGEPLYVGMCKPDGKYLIKKFSELTGNIDYANISNNPTRLTYDEAWNNKLVLTYNQIHELTGV